MAEPMQAVQVELEAISRELLRIDPKMPENDPRLWADMLEAQSSSNAYDTIDRFVLAMLELEQHAEALRRLRATWGIRQSRFEAQAIKRQEVITRLMTAVQLTSLARPAYTATLSAGPPHVIATLDPKDMPDRFRRISYETNKRALADAMRAGEDDVPAEWSNRQIMLSIRTT